MNEINKKISIFSSDILSEINSESLSKSLSSGKHETFPYFEKVEKKLNRISHKQETKGILTTRFLNN